MMLSGLTDMMPDRRGFAPSSLSGLVLWLNAETIAQGDGTSVATWTDGSGNGKDATQGTGTRQPTYKTAIIDGRPVVRFDGTSDTMTNASFALGTSCSIYCAARTATQSGGYERIVGNENNFYLGRDPSNPSEFASFYGNGAAWNVVTGHGIRGELGVDVVSVLTSINAAGTVSAYHNGQFCQTRADAMSAFNDGYTLGASPNPNQFWDKDMCELLIYNVAHTDAERQLVESYLLSRWVTYTRFARYASNPIIPISGTPNVGWESVDVANPDVFRDTPNNRWVMNYSGNSSSSGNNWNTGLAYSTDLLTWTKEASNPVFTQSGADEAGIAANGSIVLKGATYYFYYMAGFPGKIKCATSPDLLNWTRQGVVIDVGIAGQFDATATFDPFARLMPDNITIEVFYCGRNDPGNTRGVGRATATDGITFTKQGLLLSSVTAGGRADNFGEPNPLGDTGTTYELSVDRAVIDGARSISRFMTTDGGTTWVFQGNFIPAASGWDSVNVFDGCPIVHNGTLYLFYAGAPNLGNAANMGAQIGVATRSYP